MRLRNWESYIAGLQRAGFDVSLSRCNGMKDCLPLLAPVSMLLAIRLPSWSARAAALGGVLLEWDSERLLDDSKLLEAMEELASFHPSGRRPPDIIFFFLVCTSSLRCHGKSEKSCRRAGDQSTSLECLALPTAQYYFRFSFKAFFCYFSFLFFACFPQLLLDASQTRISEHGTEKR